MARASILPALLCSAFLLTSCSSGPTDPSPRELPRSLTSQEQQIADAGGTFGLKLFQAVSGAEGDKNVFLGPLSVSMALGMALNGAEGVTYEEMQQALELAGLTEEEINTACSTLIELLTNVDPRVVFEIANSIWYREGFPIAPDFIERNQEYFDAEVRGLDFTSPGAVDAINDWVDAKTNGKISQIIDRIPPAAVLYLINAIYFKGTWTYQFDPQDTAHRTFTRADDTTVQVPMMQLDGDLPVFEDAELIAVDLPYGGELFSMTLMMPTGGGDLDSLIAGLDALRWGEITAGLTETPVDLLQVPKFTSEYEVTLNGALQALGMQTAFVEGEADLSRMRSDGIPNLFISRVLHKTFVEVNEEGTEAAAVTAVEVMVTSVVPSTEIRFNRPFVYIIRERTSGAILFIGKMMDPLAG